MEKPSFFEHYPAVPLLASLLSGIVLGRMFCLSVNIWWLICPTTFMLFLCSFLHSFRQLQTVCILLSSMLTGMTAIVLAEETSSCHLPSSDQVYEAVVADEPTDKGRTVRADLTIVSGSLQGRKVRAYFQKDSLCTDGETLQAGQGIVFYSRVLPSQNYTNSAFDYPTYLRTRGIVGQTYIDTLSWQHAKVSLSSMSVLNKVQLFFICLRHRLLCRYKNLDMIGQGLAVASAVTLGDKSGLTADMRELYSKTGTSHLLALSGMHLAIIFSFLMFGSQRRHLGLARCVCCILAVWAYVFLVGMPVSVVRAAVMLSIYVIVKLSDRDGISVNSLSFTAFLMLAVNPLLLYDMGFQLSYVSVLSIILLYSPIASMCTFVGKCPRLVAYFINLAIMSIVAQIGTCPLVVYYFGKISLYFLPANMVVVPIVLLVIYASIVLFLFSFVQPLAVLASSVMMVLLNTGNIVLLKISSLPNATIENIHINILQLVLYYVMIVCICGLLLRLVRILMRQKM